MRLNFNVLWVDDQPDAIDSQIKKISVEMEREGFYFNPTKCTSLQEVQAQISNNVFADEIDLILVDWELGAGTHGDDAIAIVREAVRYKDVVFYSSLNPIDQLEKLAAEKHLEGVFCSDRAGLAEEVVGVFDSLIKKVLDIDHARGIVMGATSDIDRIVNDCLSAAHGQLDPAGQKALVASALARIDKKFGEFAKRIEKLRKGNELNGLMKAHVIFTAMDRLEILAETLELTQFKQHDKARETIRVYKADGIKGRNELGHVVLIAADRPKTAVTVEGTEISLDEMRDLRRLILTAREQFRGLLAQLQPAAAVPAASSGPPNTEQAG
jgi:hypothetical protein